LSVVSAGWAAGAAKAQADAEKAMARTETDAVRRKDNCMEYSGKSGDWNLGDA
jgi:hypothetical protein